MSQDFAKIHKQMIIILSGQKSSSVVSCPLAAASSNACQQATEASAPQKILRGEN